MEIYVKLNLGDFCGILLFAIRKNPKSHFRSNSTYNLCILQWWAKLQLLRFKVT
jgi:hypothetical protein